VEDLKTEAVPCERCGAFTKDDELGFVGAQRLCPACQTIRRGELPLHPVRRLYAFAVLTSPVVALWLLATNVARLGFPKEARWLRVGAAGLLVLAAVLGANERVPAVALVAPQLGVLLVLTGRWKDRIDGHFLQGGARAPLLPTVVAVAVVIIVFLAGLGLLLAHLEPAPT
jgi:hypothetical protein